MVLELWDKFVQTRDKELRQKIVLNYVPLVKLIVNRLNIKVPRTFDAEDLMSCGFMGLIEAVDKFDPNNGVKFETYASYRIKGAILDQIRKANWLPRSVFKKIQVLMETYQKLEQSEDELTEQNVAKMAGMSLEEFHETLVDISNISCVSLDEVMIGYSGGKFSALETAKDVGSPDPLAILEDRELRKGLRLALERLSEKDKLVLSLYYNERLTLKEIGKVLNISESRVCQLHGRAILRLKSQLEELEYA
ncbi:MAG: FliA/WhiG family RNA polymerase sigma factor [Dehalobacterium sp.]